MVLKNSIAINPLNWKRDETYAAVDENLGSFVLDEKTGEYELVEPGIADARVDTERGVVVCTGLEDQYNAPAEVEGGEAVTLFGTASLHRAEYGLFYRNIEENVKVRIGAFTGEEQDIPSDYSNASNWLHVPDSTEKPVDTVYFYPTAYINAAPDAPLYCSIDSDIMRPTAQSVYEQQATVYEESTNVFAPYYRQVNLAAVSGVPTDERDAMSAYIPQTDAFAALDYYFEHYNEGRPFILAAHSQGSQMLTNVLGKYLDEHREYLDRMVAAYVIGYSVTDEYMSEHPYLKFAEGETDTGVIISWNTEGEGNRDQDSFVILPGAKCINPLNWKTDDTYAGAEENLGARLLNEDTGEYETVPEAADAVIDPERGVIITTTTAIEPVVADGFGTDSFHNGDYSLYYYNLVDF